MIFKKNMTGEEAAKAAFNMLALPTFAWNKLYKLELFVKGGISFPSIYYEDLACTSRLMIKAQRVVMVQKPYYHYCLRRSGITGNFGIRNVSDFLKAIDIIRHFLWEEQLWKPGQRPSRTICATPGSCCI